MVGNNACSEREGEILSEYQSVLFVSLCQFLKITIITSVAFWYLWEEFSCTEEEEWQQLEFHSCSFTDKCSMEKAIYKLETDIFLTLSLIDNLWSCAYSLKFPHECDISQRFSSHCKIIGLFFLLQVNNVKELCQTSCKGH